MAPALAALAVAGCGDEPAAPAEQAARKAPANTQPGVPPGWKPAQTRATDLVVKKPGEVIEDLLLRNGANLIVSAPDVTIRRVKLEGGHIQNWPGGPCSNGMLVEDTTIAPPAGRSSSLDSEPAIGTGGYTARRVKIWRRSEGFRVGGRSGGCGPVRIEHSLAKMVIPDGHCEEHADGVQGFDGPPLTLSDTTVDFTEAACGTAPVFLPDGQGNTSVAIRNVLLIGGGIPFRVSIPATVTDLRIADRSWVYAPVDVDCSLVRRWSARIVKVNVRADYRITRTVRRQACA